MTVQITASEGGKRCDALLAEALPELSRSYVQQLISLGKVRLNGRPVKKSSLAEAGDVLTVEVPEKEPLEILPQNISLDVAYEDNDVIVVNKPKGMVVHPAPGHPDGTLVNALLWHCGASLSGINGVLRPGIVHRIDMDTSGLIIAAKNDAAHQALEAQLRDHSLARTYEAIVRGRLREDAGTVDAPIGRHPVDRKRMCVTDRNSREAVTHWEVLGRYEGYTHVRCRLETGRTHQIRVHMAHIGHPVAGDVTYGGKWGELGVQGQCLHAKELRFLHPASNKPITVTSELPAYFQEALARLRSV